MSVPVASLVSTTPPQPLDQPPRTRPRTVLAVTAAAAITAAVALSWHRPGVGWLLTALVIAAGVWAAAVRGGPVDQAWPVRRMVRYGWAVAAALLIAVGTVRAAGWLFVLCVLTAVVVGCVALAGGRSAGSVALAPLRVLARLPGASRWLAGNGAEALGSDRTTVLRTTVAGLVTVVLLLVFGSLLTHADAAFAQVLSTLMSNLDAATLLRCLLSAALAAAATATAAHHLLTDAAVPTATPPSRLVRRVEWALPVAGLVTLFAGFVAVEATILFGAERHVLETAGLTYSQYARSGFWQLLAVTGLTLLVAGAAARFAPRTTRTDRVLLRTLLGLLSALALVIVASALSRMAAYEHAYGFTRQRLLVTTCELWLGAVFVLILIAGIRLRGRWIPQAALAAAVAALLGLAALNPDAFIARQNIAQFHVTGRIDLGYLRTLSSDAVPALQTLPSPYRSCVLTTVNRKLADGTPDGWFEWNLGRSIARTQLRADPPVFAPWTWCPA
ncbi:DUF4153 domain-containing protein [Hamadaea tsunoensis]|uniref:DUF4153 domain-containing protein n=1 Tax=Hamadaea tsunoensis TaxID=53368 RepID=UPI00041FC689|nr:DUF4173 domain-containing protein [Hamadaea tsunoensis]